MKNVLKQGELIAKIDRVHQVVYSTIKTSAELIKVCTEMYRTGNKYDAASVLEALKIGNYRFQSVTKFPSLHSENFVG